jgi:hypothetical protein
LSTQAEQPRPPSPEPGDGTERLQQMRAARERRDAELRAALRPLAPGERPPALMAAIIVAVAVAVAVAIGTATIHDLSRHGGSIPGGVFLSAVLLTLAVGMFRQRYWAAVSFEALLVFQMLVSCLALVLATSVYAALASVVTLGLGGWLFWKLIRVMGRIQAGQIAAEPNPPCDRVADDG